ncbi:Ctr copper transporter family-domain-containing protein [Cercophora scortea]|uniref:Copper transport protein n=1 Tax=Cercophora scortea TaxID=314031 RepID=A0AAE0J5P3_9PEZI|nr:Ctr copper transporter family-domain-containing protein [Cercophora scortea]
MDHSMHAHHDHSAMDHSSPGDASASAMCSMNMLFTWNTKNLCIVFRQWQITSPLSLVISLLAIVALVAGYEALREGIRVFEARTSKRVETAPLDGPPSGEESVTESTPFLWSTGQNRVQVTRRAHVIKSVLYGVQNFYAFMIMLIFMTYNGWVMIAVSVGAGLGYLIFGGQTTIAKDTACH